ncbi:MAG: hypothetical protein Q7S22_02485 [Candidatus Micrarchaeota archaeon]|nr:hypothetical protein [Candidatus Micrarchaeota archaeon]
MVFGKKTKGFQNPSYTFIRTNNKGVAIFNAPNTVDCYDYTFIYCHAGSGCGLQSCLQGASLTPEQLAIMPALLIFNPNPQVPADVMPTIAKITKCPAKPKEQFNELPVFCLPLGLIISFLLGAMYLSGRNPLHMFDFSSPRLPKPYKYMAHGRGVSFDVVAPIASIYSGSQEQKASLGDFAKANPLVGAVGKAGHGVKLVGKGIGGLLGSDSLRKAFKKEVFGTHISDKGKPVINKGTPGGLAGMGIALRGIFQSSESRAGGQQTLILPGGRQVQVGGGSAPPIAGSIGRFLEFGVSRLTIGAFFVDLLRSSSIGVIFGIAGIDSLSRALMRSTYADQEKKIKSKTQEFENGKRVVAANGKEIEVKIVNNVMVISEITKKDGKEIITPVANPDGYSKEIKQAWNEYASAIIPLSNSLANIASKLGPREFAKIVGKEKDFDVAMDKYKDGCKSSLPDAEKHLDKLESKYNDAFKVAASDKNIKIALETIGITKDGIDPEKLGALQRRGIVDSNLNINPDKLNAYIAKTSDAKALSENSVTDLSKLARQSYALAEVRRNVDEYRNPTEQGMMHHASQMSGVGASVDSNRDYKGYTSSLNEKEGLGKLLVRMNLLGVEPENEKNSNFVKKFNGNADDLSKALVAEAKKSGVTLSNEDAQRGAQIILVGAKAEKQNIVVAEHTAALVLIAKLPDDSPLAKTLSEILQVNHEKGLLVSQKELLNSGSTANLEFSSRFGNNEGAIVAELKRLGGNGVDDESAKIAARMIVKGAEIESLRLRPSETTATASGFRSMLGNTNMDNFVYAYAIQDKERQSMVDLGEKLTKIQNTMAAEDRLQERIQKSAASPTDQIGGMTPSLLEKGREQNELMKKHEVQLAELNGFTPEQANIAREALISKYDITRTQAEIKEKTGELKDIINASGMKVDGARELASNNIDLGERFTAKQQKDLVVELIGRGMDAKEAKVVAAVIIHEKEIVGLNNSVTERATELNSLIKGNPAVFKMIDIDDKKTFKLAEKLADTQNVMLNELKEKGLDDKSARVVYTIITTQASLAESLGEKRQKEEQLVIIERNQPQKVLDAIGDPKLIKIAENAPSSELIDLIKTRAKLTDEQAKVVADALPVQVQIKSAERSIELTSDNLSNLTYSSRSSFEKVGGLTTENVQNARNSMIDEQAKIDIGGVGNRTTQERMVEAVARDLRMQNRDLTEEERKGVAQVFVVTNKINDYTAKLDTMNEQLAKVLQEAARAGSSPEYAKESVALQKGIVVMQASLVKESENIASLSAQYGDALTRVGGSNTFNLNIAAASNNDAIAISVRLKDSIKPPTLEESREVAKVLVGNVNSMEAVRTSLETAHATYINFGRSEKAVECASKNIDIPPAAAEAIMRDFDTSTAIMGSIASGNFNRNLIERNCYVVDTSKTKLDSNTPVFARSIATGEIFVTIANDTKYTNPKEYQIFIDEKQATELDARKMERSTEIIRTQTPEYLEGKATEAVSNRSPKLGVEVHAEEYTKTRLRDEVKELTAKLEDSMIIKPSSTSEKINVYSASLASLGDPLSMYDIHLAKTTKELIDYKNLEIGQSTAYDQNASAIASKQALKGWTQLADAREDEEQKRITAAAKLYESRGLGGQERVASSDIFSSDLPDLAKQKDRLRKIDENIVKSERGDDSGSAGDVGMPKVGKPKIIRSEDVRIDETPKPKPKGKKKDWAPDDLG